MAWRFPLDKVHRGTAFGVKDALHPNGHRGSDYNGVPVGTPIKSVSDGVVAMTMTSKVLGNIIVIKTGNLYFGYCHMEKPSALAAKKKVKAGDVIGHVGNTGTASSGAHLHLTLGHQASSVVVGDVLDADAFLKSKIEEGKA